MDIIEKALEFGKEIQASEGYTNMMAAKDINDKDEALIALIDKFNTAREEFDLEMEKEESEENMAKIDELDDKLSVLYEDVMTNESMQKYMEKQKEFEKTVATINRIISISVNGGRPQDGLVDVCSEGGCEGESSGCSGCKGH